ncbi:hypothetical protein BU204_29060 [Actinophytocola xanthii]|uniref:Uncharacterized protein n=1 Tax=Actinophytocola xanthii TaxID=1912961 RepID=A0A1Q8CDX0_9PSEU|nr:hypothetical protein BU204_29060 [Actinophytocola xanthii]
MRRFQAPSLPSSGPVALVEVIDAAQRAAAQAEIGHTPAPNLMDTASEEWLVDVYTELDLQLTATLH